MSTTDSFVHPFSELQRQNSVSVILFIDGVFFITSIIITAHKIKF